MAELRITEHLAFSLGQGAIGPELGVILMCEVVPVAVAFEVFDEGPAARYEAAPKADGPFRVVPF